MVTLKPNAQMHPRSAGFTLVEALVAVTVLFVLITVAGPALTGLVVTQQLKNAGFDLTSSLVLARSEAVTRNVSVTVAPADATDWARGWTVSEQGGTVLRRQSAYGRITVAGPVRVIFNGDGRPDSVATPFSITSPETVLENGRCLRVRLSGRPSVARGGC